MSQLSPFVRFSKALSSYLLQQAEIARLDGVVSEDNGDRVTAGQNFANWVLLSALASALGATAANLEQQIATDLARVGRQDAERAHNGGYTVEESDGACPVPHSNNVDP